MHASDQGNDGRARRPPSSGTSGHDVTAVRSSLSDERALVLDQLTHLALERLTQPDLLRQLLGHLRAAMDADNAAILLLDEDAASLTIHSVEGPEATVADQVRVPVGQGVAGTIFATKAPRVIDDLRTVPVANPFLHERLRSLVGVPLLVGDQAIGALHVDSVRVGHFTAADVPFLQAIAERIALALDYARLYRLVDKARQEAEARSRQIDAVFQAMTDAVFVMDRDGRVLQMNVAAHELLGLSESDAYYARPIKDRPVLSEILDTEGHPMAADRWPTYRILQGEVLSGGSAAEIVVRRPNGQLVEVSITGAPIRDDRGAIVASVNICRDVTEHRQLERRTHAALDTLLQMAQLLVDLPTTLPPTLPPGAVSASDGATGEVTTAPAPTSHDSALPRVMEQQIARQLALLTRDMLGCVRVGIMAVAPESERLRAIAVVGLLPEQEIQWWAEQRAREARGARLGDGSSPEQTRRFHAGESLVLDMTRPPYRDIPNPYGVTTTLVVPMRTEGALVGLLSLDYGGPPHDFTTDEVALAGAVAQLGAVMLERDRLVHERAQAEARLLALEEAQQRMDTFLGVAGHELKTPLTTAVASSQLAKRRLDALAEAIQSLDVSTSSMLESLVTPLMRMIDQIEVSAHRQVRLVNDMLDVSRVQSGRLELRPEVIDLQRLVTAALDEARLQHPARVFRLQTSDTEAQVCVDPDRIGQALTNLLSNAEKYSPPITPIDVEMHIQGDAVQVRVTDHGVGIPRKEQERVWARFHRVRGVETLSGPGVGLGLGLYITREIIERHDGNVGLTSVPGRGSTFWFTLPLATSDTSDSNSQA